MDKVHKYDFLMRPIKDMMKNWNIDIANVLEDYLEEIEKMTFSFDGGKTNLNFAEASYLIQGTACVWGKKVEYLHSLVYKTLDMINKNQHEKETDNNQPDTNPNQPTQDEHEEKYIKFQLTAQKNKKPISCEEIFSSLPKPAQILDQSDLDNRGSALLNSKNEVVAYYGDLKCDSSTKLANGMVVFEKIFRDIELPVGESAPVIESENCLDAGASNNNCEHMMDILDDDPDEPDPLPSIADDEAADVFDDIITDVEEHVHGRQLRQRVAPITTTVQEETPEILPLNPHENCRTWVSKPFAKGKPFRIPTSLNQNTRKRKKEPCLKPVPTFTEFLQQRRKQLHANKSVSTETKRKTQLWKEIKSAHMLKKNNFVVAEEVDEDNLFDVNENVDHDPLIDDDHDGDVPDFDDLIDDVRENVNQNPITRSVEESISPEDISTYEDLVRHHIEKFYTSAKLFVEETSLSQRVKQWEHTVTPYLVEQEERPEFDIHQYGDEVISAFENVGDEISFSDVVKSEDKWAICRKFAATLQLANDHNFQLETDGELSLNSLKLKLISKHRSRDRFNDYAPITE